MSYREVFKPAEGQPSDPGKIFYTITSDDIGQRIIKTTAETINVSDVLGYVQPTDVGKRLYRVHNQTKDSWLWYPENAAQRTVRLARTQDS